MNANYSEQQINIMRTAFLTAYPKIFTDIDYSVEIFCIVFPLSMFFFIDSLYAKNFGSCFF